MTIKTKVAVATAPRWHGNGNGFATAVGGSRAPAVRQKGGGNSTTAAGQRRQAAPQQGGGDNDIKTKATMATEVPPAIINITMPPLPLLVATSCRHPLLSPSPSLAVGRR